MILNKTKMMLIPIIQKAALKLWIINITAPTIVKHTRYPCQSGEGEASKWGWPKMSPSAIMMNKTLAISVLTGGKPSILEALEEQRKMVERTFFRQRSEWGKLPTHAHLLICCKFSAGEMLEKELFLIIFFLFLNTSATQRSKNCSTTSD